MKIRTVLFAAAAAIALPSFAVAGPDEPAKPTAPAQLSELERDELLHRHHVNVMEVEMGAMAKQRGTVPVKKYGAMLVVDHSKADKGVQALAKLRGVTLTDHPMGVAEADAHKKSMELMARLQTLEGEAFDREYVDAMVTGHESEIERVTAALPQVTDAKVKALLRKTLPSLRKHADHAKRLQVKLTAQAQPATK